ncbi:MAG: V-type ATP synthase subunit E [Candidatus Latescibacteria bacterium]|nr:V-type ATP synthase subunit E [Candidatus Latescibacterota bacterium]
MNQELIECIKEKAEKDRKNILEKAQEKAVSILDDAQKSSEIMKRETHQKVQADAERLRDRSYNSVRFRMNAKRYELQSSAIENIWQEAEECIGKIEQSDKYPLILEALFFECVSKIPDNTVVRACSTDADTIKSLIRKSGKKLTFEEDDAIHGGIEFHWPDNKIVLRNTLSHRLSRLKAEGNIEISSILFSSREDSTV